MQHLGGVQDDNPLSSILERDQENKISVSQVNSRKELLFLFGIRRKKGWMLGIWSFWKNDLGRKAVCAKNKKAVSNWAMDMLIWFCSMCSKIIFLLRTTHPMQLSPFRATLSTLLWGIKLGSPHLNRFKLLLLHDNKMKQMLI